MTPTDCTALLLAGGASRRMGADKAGLMIAGQPLWQWQLATLRQLAPAELFLSTGKGTAFAGVESIPDAASDAGPLGGLVAGLRRASTPWLLVLAVDLPLMRPEALQGLLERARQHGRGRIPHAENRYEPLAAVYPKSALPIAERALAAGRLPLQALARELVALGLAEPDALATSEPELFRNANTPGEWQAIIAALSR